MWGAGATIMMTLMLKGKTRRAFYRWRKVLKLLSVGAEHLNFYGPTLGPAAFLAQTSVHLTATLRSVPLPHAKNSTIQKF